MRIPIFVVNLSRRPDRLAHMSTQLDRLGLPWERVEAHDMLDYDADLLAREVASTDHVRDMGPGSQCCALTNFDIYRRIVTEGLPGGLVLQDDIDLSDRIVPFLTSLDWLPDGIDLVQFEKYGKPSSLRLLGPAIGRMPGDGLSLHRLYSRTGGAACYLITRAGAERILAEKPLLRMPIDHFLFSPNISPVFHSLGVAVVNPSLARQHEHGFASDMTPERQARHKTIGARLRRFGQEINRIPWQLGQMARGARWQRLHYIDWQE